jgi:hypothetical protein
LLGPALAACATGHPLLARRGRQLAHRRCCRAGVTRLVHKAVGLWLRAPTSQATQWLSRRPAPGRGQEATSAPICARRDPGRGERSTIRAVHFLDFVCRTGKERSLGASGLLTQCSWGMAW